MFFAFLPLFHSYMIHTNDADTYFTAKEHKPIFVVLYSQWCPHCFEFKDVKEQLQEYYKGSSEVDVAQINCDREKELCMRFKGSGTPRIYISRTTIEDATVYESSRTFEDIKAFIQEYTQPPIIQIESKEHLEKNIELNKDSSVFIVQDLKNKGISQIVGDIAEKYRRFPTQFYNLTFPYYPEDSTVLYQVYPQINKVINVTNKDLTENYINDFVTEHLYPSYSLASSNFFAAQKILNKPFLALNDWRHEVSTQVRDMTARFPDDLKSVNIDCMMYTAFCKSINFGPIKTPTIAIVNVKRNTFFSFKGNMNEVEIVAWVKKVWAGKVREEGPGAGFIGFFRRNGKFIKNTLLYSLFGIIFVFIVIKLINRRNAKKTKVE